MYFIKKECVRVTFAYKNWGWERLNMLLMVRKTWSSETNAWNTGRSGCITNLTIWGKLIGISFAEADAPVN